LQFCTRTDCIVCINGLDLCVNKSGKCLDTSINFPTTSASNIKANSVADTPKQSLLKDSELPRDDFERLSPTMSKVIQKPPLFLSFDPNSMPQREWKAIPGVHNASGLQHYCSVWI
jgi:hypothetical protein